MNLAELRNEIWRATAEDTRLDPATDVSYNGGPFLTFVVNEGQRQVAKWKDKATNYHPRIHDLLGVMYYRSFYLDDTIVAVDNTADPPYMTLTNAGTNDDRYNGWVVEVTSGAAEGQIAIIFDYDGATRTARLHEAFSTAPAAGDTVKLFKRFELILPSTHAWVGDHIAIPAPADASRNEGNLLEILSIIDTNNKIELTPVEKQEKFSADLTTTGNPTQWYRYGNSIYYDRNVDSKITFRVEYYRSPTDMTLDDDEPDIPAIWHMAIVLWGKWFILQRKLESGLAYAAKMDFEDEMRRTTAEREMSKERLEMSGEVRYE